MARIVVQDDDQRTVLLDEKEVRPEHLNDRHSAAQLLERLEWAIGHAERRTERNRPAVRDARSRRDARRRRSSRAVLARQSAVGRSFD